jgi:hypothetical protein
LEKIQVTVNYKDLVLNYGIHQHAYRHLGSCTSALIKMHDTVTRMLDDTTTCAVRLVLFDLTAAFNKLRHDLLLNRMIDCTLDPMFIRWCSNYLQNRVMRVKMDDMYGTSVICPSSVPQGSVIGPYLFALFMGSLKLPESLVKKDYELIIYADDIMLIERVSKPLNLYTSYCNFIRHWCCQNYLLINDKTS